MEMYYHLRHSLEKGFAMPTTTQLRYDSKQIEVDHTFDLLLPQSFYDKVPDTTIAHLRSLWSVVSMFAENRRNMRRTFIPFRG